MENVHFFLRFFLHVLHRYADAICSYGGLDFGLAWTNKNDKCWSGRCANCSPWPFDAEDVEPDSRSTTDCRVGEVKNCLHSPWTNSGEWTGHCRSFPRRHWSASLRQEPVILGHLSLSPVPKIKNRLVCDQVNQIGLLINAFWWSCRLFVHVNFSEFDSADLPVGRSIYWMNASGGCDHPLSNPRTGLRLTWFQVRVFWSGLCSDTKRQLVRRKCVGNCVYGHSVCVCVCTKRTLKRDSRRVTRLLQVDRRFN